MNDTPPTNAPPYPFPIVGIGASAGGLEALESVFSHMPIDTGMAFVVLQHLSPNFDSKMDELLRRQTAIPVRMVTNGVRVEPDTIYLIPPSKEMIISEGRLLLTEREPAQGFSLPIDHFFRSLAADAQEMAVGVVLSGTGSDGSRGVRAIHDAGGYVIVQSPSTSRFDGMPLNAKDTGVADEIVAPEDIPEALIAFAGENGLGGGGGASFGSERVPALEQIFKLLNEAYGIDFADYKPNTILRRIDRRLSMSRVQGMANYLKRLRKDPEELDRLYQDLLIGVTRFFRDEEVFSALDEHSVGDIVEGIEPDQEIRVWVAGCATGEEAYSMAILLRERLREVGRPDQPVKIFASDIHQRSIEFASAGLYPAGALEAIDPVYRERYFVAEEDAYRVSKVLREMVVFARHNLLTDAPFTRLHLVSCRNLLIYLRPMAQAKVLSLFHFALRTGGYLLLGKSEATGELKEEFEAVDDRVKIYMKSRDVRLPVHFRPPLASAQLAGPTPTSRPRRSSFATSTIDTQLFSVYDQLLERYMPPGFLVDRHHELIHTFGGAENLTRMRGGRPSSNLVSLIHPAFKTCLSGALQHAEKEQKRVHYTGLHHDGQEYRLVVEPVDIRSDRAQHFLVTLEAIGEIAEPIEESKPVDLDEMSRDYVQALEEDLRFTRENLQATVEELETSNEELQATNEELVASNEELQSTNEELHSVNEELYTVNVEYQRKIVELTELTNDMDNLLQAVDLGVLFLDHELHIRKFTRRIADSFHLIPQDVGRRFDNFTHSINHPGLFDDIRAVRRSGEPIEMEIRDFEGRYLFLRILPYEASGEVEGVVLTLIDIGALKREEAMVRRLSAIVESSSDAITAMELDGKIIAWNEGAHRLYGYTEAEAIGADVRMVVPEEHVEEFDACLAQLAAGEEQPPFETKRCHKDGRVLDVALTLSPMFDENGTVIGASSIGRDITERKKAEEQVRRAVRQRDRFLATLSHELRNPLSTVLNASEILADADDDEALRTRTNDVLRRQTRHMARLLDDLLDVSRFRQDKVALRRQAIDLRKPVEEAVRSLTGQLDESGHPVLISLPEEAVWVDGDPDRLQQVAVNLLTNALKYSPDQTPIRLELRSCDGTVELEVGDEGVGIEPSMLEEIFEPFTQDPDDASHADGGMGLGLFLVDTIVSSHNGDIQAYSDGKGHGSRFVVSLPELEPDSSGDDGDERIVPNGAGTTIVLVEDEDDNRLLLSKLLERKGYSVLSAGDGASGLDLIRQERPPLALLDIGLPKLTGDAVARALREEFDHESLRLVAMTGYGQDSDRATITAAGFDEHLVKPVALPELLQVLQRFLTEQPEEA